MKQLKLSLAKRMLHLFVAALAATSAASSTVVLAAVDNEFDLFYVPPVPASEATPGTILRSRLITSTRALDAISQQWQLMYQSSDSLGEPVAMTGTLMVPTQADPKGLVIFAPPTSGIAFRCAPSRMLAQGAFAAQSVLHTMLAAGYAVAMADYEGYAPATDDSQPEVTYIAKSLGPALLDLARASSGHSEAGLNPSLPIALRGFSQGGNAAYRAAEMAPEYASELNIVGVAAGGVPGNLAIVSLQLEGGEAFGFLLLALLGQDNAYPELDITPTLNPEGSDLAASLTNDACLVELVEQSAFKTLQDISLPGNNPLNGPRFARISELALGGNPVTVPAFQYHDPEDGAVAYSQAAALRDSYCQQGGSITWQPIDTMASTPLLRHLSTQQRADERVMSFLAQVFTGNSPAGNCGAIIDVMR